MLRVGFGSLMALATLRVLANGWVHALYVVPVFHFSYYGFGWVKPLPAPGMYVVFAAMLLSAVAIALGAFYRVASVLFFLLFTYVELIDVATYLNHYYFVSILALLLCVIPAHRTGGLDVRWGRTDPLQRAPQFWLRTLQVQVALVYFFAGLAKVNPDWLLEAQPLRIWLHAKSDLPLVGQWLQLPWVAFAASWASMLFDVTIAFFLFWPRTCKVAYGAALVFHSLTALLFPGIGMFPLIMACAATVFLPAPLVERILLRVGVLFRGRSASGSERALKVQPVALAPARNRAALALATTWLVIQCLLPLRYLLYPGNLFYHEQGYRFSWRVMLMEKAGTVFFTLRDKASGRVYQVRNSDHLQPWQEKQMSTQPDLILQFAHHLRDHHAQGMRSPQVFAEAYVSVNGRGSRPFVDPKADLAQVQDGWAHKTWVLYE
jgi:Vitamin K-dependent gamma-carboxylase